MVLIISSEIGLKSTYGKENFENEIQPRLEKLRAVMKDVGGADLVFVDNIDEKIAEKYKLENVMNNDPDDIKDLVEKYHKKNKNAPVLIVGGHGVISFHEIDSPYGYWDHETQKVYSDVPYGAIGTFLYDYAVPEWPVGRFPDENRNAKLNKPPEERADFLVSQIKRAIISHTYGFQNNKKEAIACTSPEFAVVTKKVRKGLKPDAEMKVVGIAEVGSNKITELNKTDISSKVYHYYNVHGARNGQWWSYKIINAEGEVDATGPVFTTPKTFTNANMNGTVVFSEACFGAYTSIIENSMAFKFLKEGVICYVGSTGNAYGNYADDEDPNPMPLHADILARKFLEKVTEPSHQQFGQALVDAKDEFFQECCNVRTPDEKDLLTLAAFNLFGDPTSRL